MANCGVRRRGGIASRAYRTATGERMPSGVGRVPYPKLDPAWDVDFDDLAEMRRRLPHLSALVAG